HFPFHEPQGAAGILPAEESKKSSADETSAAPWWRHGPTRSSLTIPNARQQSPGGSLHEPPPLPALSPALGGGEGGRRPGEGGFGPVHGPNARQKWRGGFPCTIG